MGRSLARIGVLSLSVLAALAAFAPPRAFAQRTSSLSWVRLEGTEDCISTQALAERVEQRLGRRVFVSASQADLSLEGRVERTTAPSTVIATLVVSDRSGRVLGRRVLRTAGPSCEALEASLVLVIAIAIDPGASLPAVRSTEQGLSDEARVMLEQLDLPELDARQIAQLAVPDTELERTRDAPAPAQPRAQPQPRPPTPRDAADAQPQSALALRVSLGLALEFGVLPDPSLGAVLGVNLAPPGFLPIELSVFGSLAQERSIAAEPSAFSLQLFAAGLALCPPLARSGRLLLRACGGARVGALIGEGRGFAQSLDATGPWLEAVLSAGTWLRLGALSLHASGGAGAPLLRDEFEYEDRLGDPRALHRAAPVTGRFEFGAGLHFH